VGYIKDHWGFLTAPGQYQGVDLLRSMAVSLVLLFHFAWLPFGWMGVDLFFILSGFLIGGILIDQIRSDRFTFKEFYLRRALRILPIYYFMIVLCVFTKAWPLPWDATALRSLASGVFFLHSTGPYFFPEVFRIDSRFLPGGTWSLVIEEMFYLVAPLAILVVLRAFRGSARACAVTFGFVALLAIGVRLFMTRSFAPDDANRYFVSFVQFHSRFDELAYGVIGACLIRMRLDLVKFWPYLYTAAGALFAGFIAYLLIQPRIWKEPYLITAGTIWIPTVLGLSGLCALLVCYQMPIRAKSVIVLARLSYSLYLVHVLFLELVRRAGDGQWWPMVADVISTPVRDILGMAGCVFLSYLLSLLVEYPFIRLYKKPPKAVLQQQGAISNA